jgi:hypothetical protein
MSDGGYEKFYLLGYNVVKPVGNQATFLKKISPPYSPLKNTTSKKPA